MLQTKPLQDLLSQALSSTIQTAVLATPQGTLIAHAVKPPPNSSSQTEGPRRQARSLAAIANVIWKNYANIKNIDGLWDTPNGTSDGDVKAGLIWMAVDCEVRLALSSFINFRMVDCFFIKLPQCRERGYCLLFQAQTMRRLE